jgi:DUF4097 and DUF4098 domain-containing protein YvlB
MLKKTFYLMFLFLSLTAAGWSADYSDLTERTFEIQGTPDLLLRNPDGAIHILAQERSTVEIKITRKVFGAKTPDAAKREAERISFEIDQTANQIRVITRWPRDGFRMGSSPSVSIRYDVYTPVQSNLRAEVSDGELRINGLQGALELVASDGDIFATNVSGDVRVQASDGSIDLKDSSGKMEIRLSDGDLISERCTGQMQIVSGDGRVEVRGFQGNAEISNGDGDILMEGVLKSFSGRIGDGDMLIQVAAGSVMETDWILTAGDGDIILELPDDFSADLQVSTGDGTVETNHPISVLGGLSSRRVSGKIREGGHLLRIKTSDGDIAIR